MGLLINDELIWVSIPKCASTSVEDALFKSNLNIKQTWRHDEFPNTHLHIPLDELYSIFGKKETICIKRDPLERWISSLKTIWLAIQFRGYVPIVNFEDVDNEFLYRTFDKTFVNNLYHHETVENCLPSIVNNYTFSVANFTLICNLMTSQNFWKNNEKCTYEFDILEIDKLQDFFYKKYNENLIIPNINPNELFDLETSNKKHKIIIDDKLKYWYWEMFEKRFEKTNKLI